MLAGKTALVTGAARGIGRATARVLAEQGADVAVADALPAVAEVAEEVRALGRRAAHAVFDVADPAAVAAGVAELRGALGPIDVLVNNAGIVANLAPVARMTPEAWERELRVNLSGAFHCAQAVLDSMVERRFGRIVSVSSIAAVGGLHNQPAYAASKAGLLGLTQSIALEHARHGVTANAVLPGLIGTENVRQHMPAEIRDFCVRQVPARRLGEPEEVAWLIAFLASPHAGFVNGAAIPIDGGFRLNVIPLGSRREVAEILGTVKPKQSS